MLSLCLRNREDQKSRGFFLDRIQMPPEHQRQMPRVAHTAVAAPKLGLEAGAALRAVASARSCTFAPFDVGPSPQTPVSLCEGTAQLEGGVVSATGVGGHLGAQSLGFPEVNHSQEFSLLRKLS